MKASIQRVPPTEAQFVVRIEGVKNLEAGADFVNITASEGQIRKFLESIATAMATAEPK